MPQLVLLNGPPGAGKSTLARRYADAHPLVLDLDVDVVRSLLGAWTDHLADAGIAARALALAMARVHLSAGRDVVVPQFLGRRDFVLALEALCVEVDARFVEVVLRNDSEEAAGRFAERVGSADEVSAMAARLVDVVASREATAVVRVVEGDVEATYRRLLAALAATS